PRRAALPPGQQPSAIVQSCADSRVAPEHVFDSGLGELFVIRVAGNVVNDDVLASIEYAATHTGSSLLIVMGHTGCGAITAATSHPEGQELSPNMRALLARLEPAVEKVRNQAKNPQDLVALAVRANVLRAATETHSRSAILRDLENKGRFAILPVVYDIASGDIAWLKDAPDGSEVALPAAAPMGETEHSHAEPDQGHGNHDDGHQTGGHGDADAHGHAQGQDQGHDQGHAEQHVPDTIVNWADPVAHNGNSEHGEHGAVHGDGHESNGHDEHGDAHGGSDDGHGVEHGAHGSGHEEGAHGEDHAGDHGHESQPSAETAAPAAHGKGAWLDPIPIVGITGIVSLLLAAAVAMLKR
ncbi:MAG: hypothetical protein KDC98_01345, partial [Planctomycetes bacterium]|nr:hypothetical protein [Planctomycetota bacterium]